MFLADKNVTTVKQTETGEIWAGTTNGLYLFDIKANTWQKKLTVGITCIAELKDGGIIVGGNDGCRIQQQDTASSWTSYSEIGQLILGMTRVSDGTLWCRSDKGIFSYDGADWTDRTGQTPGLSDPISGGSDSRGNIYESKDKAIWFTDWTTYRYQDGIVTPHSIGTVTYFLSETNDGLIWAGGQEGPFQYDGKSWKLVEGYGDVNNADARPWKLYQTSDGTIWVHGSQGLWTYDGTIWKRELQNSGEVLFEDANGIFWAGCNDGIYYLDQNNQWIKSKQYGYIRMIEETS